MAETKREILSEQTKGMSEDELLRLQEQVSNMTEEELKVFRNDLLYADDMGFFGEESI